jgi:hypothetical protein
VEPKRSNVRRLSSAELFSFTTDIRIRVSQALHLDQIHDMFQLPMSEIAFQQYSLLSSELENLQITDENDIWSYICGNAQFSVSKTYKALAYHSSTPIFIRLWSSKCQRKHRVFFWLLQDKLNTRDRLRRRHMELDSYICENCIFQRQETVYHLFI